MVGVEPGNGSQVILSSNITRTPLPVEKDKNPELV
jgi:hypothetical protein